MSMALPNFLSLADSLILLPNLPRYDKTAIITNPFLIKGSIRTMFTIPWIVLLPTRTKSSGASIPIWSKKAGRSPELIYYDVTNFYFEIEDPDDDILDDEGNVIEKGQRKFGVCKEERKLPIVQMGLFMDDSGLPIAIESFPGNTLDHLTLRPALKKNIDGLDFSRFILIADRGICNYMNLLHVLDAGNGYIVSKSLLKSTKKEQEWTYRDDDYIKTSEDFKYKSRIVKRSHKDENGQNRTIEEKSCCLLEPKISGKM